MSFKQLKRFLLSNFLALADIKVFGHTTNKLANTGNQKIKNLKK